MLRQITSLENTLIRHRNDIEKSMWRAHQHLIAFESRLSIESTSFPRGFVFHHRWNNGELLMWNVDVESTANQQRYVYWVFSFKLECFIIFMASSLLVYPK